jgi:hypothetical protein
VPVTLIGGTHSPLTAGGDVASHPGITLGLLVARVQLVSTGIAHVLLVAARLLGEVLVGPVAVVVVAILVLGVAILVVVGVLLVGVTVAIEVALVAEALVAAVGIGISPAALLGLVLLQLLDRLVDQCGIIISHPAAAVSAGHGLPPLLCGHHGLVILGLRPDAFYILNPAVGVESIIFLLAV